MNEPQSPELSPAVQASFDLLQKTKNDPILFVRTILHAEPEPWQADFLIAVATQDHIAVRSGHGVGKTTALAWLILWFLLNRHPIKIGVTGASAGGLEDTIWAELRSWHLKMDPEFKRLIEIKADRAEFTLSPGDSFATLRTASRENPTALQGLHSDNLVFIIDEAPGVDDQVFEVAQGSMSTKGAKTIMTGNPTKARGYFYDAFNTFPDEWHLMKVSCIDRGRVDPKYITRMKNQHGESRNVYRVRVLGEFPEEDADTLIARSLVEDATNRNVTQIDAPIVWGLDVARTGDDRRALCKRKGNRVLAPIKWWVKKDTRQTADIVKMEYQNTPPDERPVKIYIDVIGIGAGVVDYLKRDGLPVEGVNVAESPAAVDQYHRLRDELWLRGKEWFEARDCSIPDDKVLKAELTQVRYGFSNAGKLMVERKEQMKKRLKGGKSPDVADRFILTMMNTSKSRWFTQAVKQPSANWIV